MYIVYAIFNSTSKKIYIGQTNNLKKRLRLHNNKTFQNCYTSKFDGEWRLIYQEKVSTRHEALKREKELKSFRGREFIKQYIK